MIYELVSALAILGVAIIFLNPGHLAMPDNAVSMLSVALIISFLFFATYILKEKTSDEREAVHILKAGRISYLVGAGALIIGLLIQVKNHEIDPWLIFALCAMVFSKLVSRIYSHFKM